MNNSTGKAIVGFIFGAAVGVAAGMLLAPRKGDETWRMLQDNAKEYSDDLSRNVGRKIDDLKGYMTHMAQEKREKAEPMAREAKETIKKNMPQ
ncbi:MAG: YtxH domain-containing protein [Bacteroidales bacterium]